MECFVTCTFLRKTFTSKNLIYTFFFVGKKGEKGESSKAEIAIVEKTVSNLQKNLTEIYGNGTVK